MEEEAPSEDTKYELPWIAKLTLYPIVFGGLGVMADEMIFNRHDERDICERAAQMPDKAFRDVMRACGLGEYRKLPASEEE